MPLDQIPPEVEGRRSLVRVVIETPRGCRNKYSYDPELGTFILRKVLPEGHVFPYDFGFVPQTRGDDGDPLDVLVMMDEPAFAGCVVECRLIAILEAKQTEAGRTERNDRFVAVADRSIEYARYREVRDLTSDTRRQIEHFFVSYNELAGKRFQPLRWAGAKAASKVLAAGRTR